MAAFEARSRASYNLRSIRAPRRVSIAKANRASVLDLLRFVLAAKLPGQIRTDPG